MVHAALLLLMLEAVKCETSFHHQPEAQHPKSSAIHKNAGRLSHLLANPEVEALGEVQRLTHLGHQQPILLVAPSHSTLW